LEYLRLRRQVELLNELYVFMQLRQKEAEVTAASESGGAHIVDPAEEAIEPVRPKPLLTMLLALIGGIGMGVGGAVLLEHAASSREEGGTEVLP
jgi:tyrosine-protein kinase Etk/Wzc